MPLKRTVGDFEGRVNQILLLKSGGPDDNEGSTGRRVSEMAGYIIRKQRSEFAVGGEGRYYPGDFTVRENIYSYMKKYREKINSSRIYPQAILPIYRVQELVLF